MNRNSVSDWTKWWADDIPCHFSPDQAIENAAYLSELLGSRFLTGTNHPIGEVKHPILQRWKTRGAGAFLELNALASDLRVVSGVDGFAAVLEDLKNSNTCLATWHTIHSAALLGRAPGVKIVQFFPQTDEPLPDFSVAHEGQTVMCEAKLLAKSGQEEVFDLYASHLLERINTGVTTEKCIHPSITVVLKSVHSLPPVDDVVRVVAEGLTRYSNRPLVYRTGTFNVFLDSSQSLVSNVTESRSCFLLCPKSEKEDLRVHSRGAKASRQLTSKAAADHPGLFFLSITYLQDSRHVANLFRKRFDIGQYSGIAGLVLIQSGTHLEPPVRAPIDLIATVRNSRSIRPHPNLTFQTVGLAGRFPSNLREEIPAYRHLSHEIRVGDGFAGVVVPDIKALKREMLE